MKLLVDGVAFQLAGSDGARVWQSILPALAAHDDLDVMVLDRGGLPAMAGVTRIPFPTYKDRYTADDSALIQRICDFYEIDVFTSTHHTTPLSTPMFLVVHDMIAELFDADPKQRRQQERAIAIAYARRHICLSARTRDDLLKCHPTLDHADVAPAGVDHTVFRRVDADLVASFRRRIGFAERPYLVTYARPHGRQDATLLFDTIATFGIDSFDILCVGSAPGSGQQQATVLPALVRVGQVDAFDADLAVALSGAAALVYPSRYEGFGLPVLEAMACGCPVVTTAHGALPEVTGDACLIVDGTSRSALADALVQLQSDAVQDELRRAGLERAAPFDWSTLVAAVAVAARETAALGSDAEYQAFAATWTSLRLMQAAVDADTWTPSA